MWPRICLVVLLLAGLDGCSKKVTVPPTTVPQVVEEDLPEEVTGDPVTASSQQ